MINKEIQKKLEKVKKRVLNKFPNAKLKFDYDGYYYISSNDENLAEEYLLPSTKSELIAWEYALLSIKTTQNFNRTHPIRIDMFEIESKLERVEKRRPNHNRKRCSVSKN